MEVKASQQCLADASLLMTKERTFIYRKLLPPSSTRSYQVRQQTGTQTFFKPRPAFAAPGGCDPVQGTAPRQTSAWSHPAPGAAGVSEEWRGGSRQAVRLLHSPAS